MQSVQFDAEVEAERAQSQARLAYRGVLPQAKRIIKKALRIGRGAFALYRKTWGKELMQALCPRSSKGGKMSCIHTILKKCYSWSAFIISKCFCNKKSAAGGAKVKKRCLLRICKKG